MSSQSLENARLLGTSLIPEQGVEHGHSLVFITCRALSDRITQTTCKPIQMQMDQFMSMLEEFESISPSLQESALDIRI